MATAKLFTAWAWRCPSCGHRNVHAGNVVDDPEILAEARKAMDIPDDQPGEYVAAPDVVFCAKCEEKFDTEIV
jgi:hypothetical protein